MIPWLIMVCVSRDGDELDVAEGPCHTANESLLGQILWDGQTAQLARGEDPPTRFTPPCWVTVEEQRYAAVVGRIDEPAPAQRTRRRLPDSRAPQGLLLVQDGSFRGCYFAVGSDPCWLGQGARVLSEEPRTVTLYTGTAPLTISGRECPAETAVPLKDGDTLSVGRRRFEFVALPSEPVAAPSLLKT